MFLFVRISFNLLNKHLLFRRSNEFCDFYQFNLISVFVFFSFNFLFGCAHCAVSFFCLDDFFDGDLRSAERVENVITFESS